jgi:hypothetical protein
MAAIELSVLNRHCLDRRIPHVQTLATEVAAWARRRNRAGAAVTWQSSATRARIQLEHLHRSLPVGRTTRAVFMVVEQGRQHWSAVLGARPRINFGENRSRA